MIIKLTKGRSYAMKGFLFKTGSPKAVDDETGEKLLATGRFVNISDASQPEPKARELSYDDIYEMTKAELSLLASEKNIDITGCKTKNDMVERICGMLGLASTVKLGLED